MSVVAVIGIFGAVSHQGTAFFYDAGKTVIILTDFLSVEVRTLRKRFQLARKNFLSANETVFQGFGGMR